MADCRAHGGKTTAPPTFFDDVPVPETHCSFFLHPFIPPQEWIQQNHILSIVLRDSLHQPQYVEKLEKILRFVIKEKALTMQDLDNIWAAQVQIPRSSVPL